MAEKTKVTKKAIAKSTKAVTKSAKAPAKKTTKPAAKSTKSVAKSTKSVQKPVGKVKVRKVMKEYKEDELHSGSKTGPKVKERKQAIAIALSEGRKAESGKYKTKKTSVRKKSK